MKRRTRTTTIIVLSLAIIIIAAFISGVIRPIRSATDQALNPVSRVTYHFSSAIRNGISLLASVGSLNDQNQALEQQVDDLKKQLADVKEIQLENDQLRAQLNFPQMTQYNLVSARVLGASADSVRTILQIDKGSSAGLQEGMAVISGGSLVGVVDSVDRFSAKIIAINDPVFKISALTQSSRTSGIVSGQLGTGLKMEKIGQNEAIAVGETVITSGSGLVPKGILIGQVESVQRADNAIFQAANIKPNVDTAKLEIVFIITGQK